MTQCTGAISTAEGSGGNRALGLREYLFREARFDFRAAGVDSIALLGILRGVFRNVIERFEILVEKPIA